MLFLRIDLPGEMMDHQKNYYEDYGDDNSVEKTVRIGGFFGKMYTVKKMGDKIVYERVTKQATFKGSTTTQSLNEGELKNGNPSYNNLNNKKDLPSFVICQQCGTQFNPNLLEKCPNCNFRI